MVDDRTVGFYSTVYDFVVNEEPRGLLDRQMPRSLLTFTVHLSREQQSNHFS